jgi:hypothetical protein
MHLQVPPLLAALADLHTLSPVVTLSARTVDHTPLLALMTRGPAGSLVTAVAASGAAGDWRVTVDTALLTQSLQGVDTCTLQVQNGTLHLQRAGQPLAELQGGEPSFPLPERWERVYPVTLPGPTLRRALTRVQGAVGTRPSLAPALKCVRLQCGPEGGAATASDGDRLAHQTLPPTAAALDVLLTHGALGLLLRLLRHPQPIRLAHDGHLLHVQLGTLHAQLAAEPGAHAPALLDQVRGQAATLELQLQVQALTQLLQQAELATAKDQPRGLLRVARGLLTLETGRDGARFQGELVPDRLAFQAQGQAQVNPRLLLGLTAALDPGTLDFALAGSSPAGATLCRLTTPDGFAAYLAVVG